MHCMVFVQGLKHNFPDIKWPQIIPVNNISTKYWQKVLFWMIRAILYIDFSCQLHDVRVADYWLLESDLICQYCIFLMMEINSKQNSTTTITLTYLVCVYVLHIIMKLTRSTFLFCCRWLFKQSIDLNCLWLWSYGVILEAGINFNRQWYVFSLETL